MTALTWAPSAKAKAVTASLCPYNKIHMVTACMPTVTSERAASGVRDGRVFSYRIRSVDSTVRTFTQRMP